MTDEVFSGAEPGAPVIVPAHPDLGEPELVYPYVDEVGAPIFFVCRFRTEDGKDFRQGHPRANGVGWIWNLRGVEPVLYRLDELTSHLAAGKPGPVYICEGEKDADNARAQMLVEGIDGVATTSPMGAGKWRETYTETLRGARHVVIISDFDKVGREHANTIAQELAPYVEELELLRPALDHEKADLTDHLEAGLRLSELIPLVDPIEENALELEAGPLLMAIEDFVALQVEPPPPLWGTADTALLAQGGLALWAGRPGTGKTTAILDLACHLAAGVPWPPRDEETKRAPEPWPVPRPLRIAILENEGPQEMFRDAAKRKLQAFGPERIREAGGYLGVQVWRWGAFSFADNDAFVKAATEFDELAIDLVIGDPLNMLGVEGVGSPADTRLFVQRLRMLGLGSTRAFLLIHHFREKVEHHEDELRKLSGAWGGHLDTLISLSATAAENEARLAFPKLRWARGEMPKPIILGRVYNIRGFEALGLEEDETLLEPKLVEALTELRNRGEGYGGKGWQTSRNLAGQIHASKMKVPKVLAAAPHLFALREGVLAKEYGAKKGTKLWGLRVWDDAPEEGASSAAEAAPAGQEELELDGSSDVEHL